MGPSDSPTSTTATTIDDLPCEMLAAILCRLDPCHQFVCTLRRTFLAEAARNGRLSLVQWAVEAGCPWDDGVCPEAVHRGHLDLLAWMQTKGCPWSVDRCLVAAAAGGHVDLATHVRSNKQATLNGNCDVLAVLLKDRRANVRCAWHVALNTGNVALLDWLYGRDRGVPESALGGHGHITERVWSATAAEECTVIVAARHVWPNIDAGPFDKPPPPRSLLWRHVALEAARNGHLDVVTWLGSAQRMPQTLTLAAAYGGRTHVLVWAAANGVWFSGLTTAIASLRGHEQAA
ncbi:F-box domain-containing protein [Pandoravirus kuranda]|uniref:F-box domain-containing protein n=1 Tax=Pandoravirus kuranda TaxID=3019033 RepID=A0AA95EIH8_9VIRU|nr:F-box domain-containing protein [Pandoravirus kuranda]